ncbi:hypothetical protein [Nocardioides taihuensis]|uniref:DUF1192 domain-containing protein n=1 Tax=Nocardioides taihuensis TaxID=1835606 RepID=A0ABW0BCT4_9ACTN
MCTTHAHTTARRTAPAEEPESGHCGHCSHDDLTLEELKGRRAELDQDIAARELTDSGAGRLTPTA